MERENKREREKEREREKGGEVKQEGEDNRGDKQYYREKMGKEKLGGN